MCQESLQELHRDHQSYQHHSSTVAGNHTSMLAIVCTEQSINIYNTQFERQKKVTKEYLKEKY